jgi:hypothetical protein
MLKQLFPHAVHGMVRRLKSGGEAMRQAVIYLRVSTVDQTTANQERELREIASRMGCEIVKVYRGR